MVLASVLEVVRVGARGRGVVSDHQRDERREGAHADRVRPGSGDVVRRSIIRGALYAIRTGAGAEYAIRAGKDYTRVELLRRVDLEDKGRRREDLSRETR